MVNCAASHTLYIKDGLSHRDFTIWEFWDFVTGFSNQTLTMHDCILLAKTGVQTSLIGCMSDSILLLLLLTGQINFYSRFKMTELTKVSACQHRCCHTPSFLFLAFKKHPCALHHGSLWGLAFRLSKFWLKSGASRLLFGINRSIVDSDGRLNDAVGVAENDFLLCNAVLSSLQEGRFEHRSDAAGDGASWAGTQRRTGVLFFLLFVSINCYLWDKPI